MNAYQIVTIVALTIIAALLEIMIDSLLGQALVALLWGVATLAVMFYGWRNDS